MVLEENGGGKQKSTHFINFDINKKLTDQDKTTEDSEDQKLLRPKHPSSELTSGGSPVKTGPIVLVKSEDVKKPEA